MDAWGGYGSAGTTSGVPTRLAVVTVEIWNPSGPPYAARDVKETDLTGSGDNGFDDVWLDTVRVAGHLGQFGIDHLHGVIADSYVIVGGDLLSSLSSDLNHASLIQIGGNVAAFQRIEADGAIGNVTLGGCWRA